MGDARTGRRGGDGATLGGPAAAAAAAGATAAGAAAVGGAAVVGFSFPPMSGHLVSASAGVAGALRADAFSPALRAMVLAAALVKR